MISDIIIDETDTVIFADDPQLIGVKLDLSIEVPVVEVEGELPENCVAIDVGEIPRLKRWEVNTD